MYNNTTDVKEIIIEEFLLDSFESMFLYFKFLNYPVNSITIKKYSSLLISTIIELLEQKEIYDIIKIKVFIKNYFFKGLKNLYYQDEIKTMKKLEKVNETSIYIIFYIWCIDSYYYFLKISNNSYTVLKKYSDFINYVLKNKKPNDNLFCLTEALYTAIDKKIIS